MKKLLDRRTMVLSCLVLLLLVVGFTYNSVMSDDYLIDEEAMSMEEGMIEEGLIDEGEGDVALDPLAVATGTIAGETNTNKTEETKSAFFVEYRLEREKNRGKEKELWEDIINSEKSDTTFKTLAQQELVKLVSLTEKEMIIENLIIAKGFSEALVFLGDDNATVVVNSKELTQQQVAQIQDIIVRKSSIAPANIKIMQKD